MVTGTGKQDRSQVGKKKFLPPAKDQIWNGSAHQA